MKSTAMVKRKAPPSAWDAGACSALIEELWALRASVLARERELAPTLKAASASHRAGARNLAHYLALRAADRRALQGRLNRLGISSLGHGEASVLASIDKTLGILHRLAGRRWTSHSGEEPVGHSGGQRALERHTRALLGAPPNQRRVRMMVTLPVEAATDAAFVRSLVESGMDVARINCAHDGAAEWRSMAGNVRRAAEAAGREVRVLMDLGGPKLRTGAMSPGPAVLKLRPERDDYGRMVAPALLGLRAAGSAPGIASAPASVEVEPRWLASLQVGDDIRLTDARGARRTLKVVRRDDGLVVAESAGTAYLTTQTRLERKAGRSVRASAIRGLPAREVRMLLARGERVRLVDATRPQAAGPGGMRTIGCTLPEVFGQVRAGERIWFDDGRIGGIVRATHRHGLDIEIVHARETGSKLAGDKGINLPDSVLDLPALTAKDREDLAVVAEIADLVGLSFVTRGDDVADPLLRLEALGRPDMGIILKIETRRAFDNLPELLLAAMAGRAVGIMIARGDLAVECGYERLAEVQEEILWVAEAAHMPVIWATQVLDGMARTGQPSRAEITDAAMGERAECVMLNKGPYIIPAMRTLDDILRRMQAHQTKRRAWLRALANWEGAARVSPVPRGAPATGPRRARKPPG